jgi:hypothetical protein
MARSGPEKECHSMRKLILTIAATLGALPLALSMPSVAHAAPCRDAKGKFAKCPGAAPAKAKVTKTTTKTTTAATPAPAAKPMAVHVSKVTVKTVPCKDAKGKFIKCK